MNDEQRRQIVEQVLIKLRERGVGQTHAAAQDAVALRTKKPEAPARDEPVELVPPQVARKAVAETLGQASGSPAAATQAPASFARQETTATAIADLDLTSPAAKSEILIPAPKDRDALLRMKQATTARIGVNRAGARLNTRTMLTLRADHAQARDAVFADVSPKLLESLGLFTVQSRCEDKNTFLTRPDLGRRLNEEAVETIRSRCVMNPDVQIFAADGLSSTAIEANLANILPVLTEALAAKGLSVGTPFFVRHGRVAVEDEVAEIVGCKVVSVLIGERPGLATAESMSAYTVYNAYVGMPESRRTVVSNIHKDGIAAVEAGAYLADVIEQVLEARASGVELTK